MPTPTPEARSCLAALADSAAEFDESVRFEHSLLDLDGLHEGDHPAPTPWPGTMPRPCAGWSLRSTDCSTSAVTASPWSYSWPTLSADAAKTVSASGDGHPVTSMIWARRLASRQVRKLS